MSGGGSTAAGAVMVIAGIWLLLQTLVGGLTSRLLGLAHTTTTTKSPAPATGSKHP